MRLTDATKQHSTENTIAIELMPTKESGAEVDCIHWLWPSDQAVSGVDVPHWLLNIEVGMDVVQWPAGGRAA